MKRQQIIVLVILGVGLAVFSFLGWWLLVRPVSQKISAAEEERTATQAKLDSAKQKAAQHEKFQVEAENIRKSLAFIQARLKGTKHTTDIYRTFYALAGTWALKDFEMKNEARVTAKGQGFTGMDEIPVILKFKGNYGHLGNFLNSTAEQEVLIIGESIDLNSIDSTGRNASISGELKLKVICEKEEKKQ